MNLFNPVVLVVLLAVLYFWNGYRIKNKKQKKRKSFRKSYQDKKKDQKN